MAIQGFFTGDVKIRDLNGVLKAVDGIVEVATDAGTVTSVGIQVGSTGTDVNVANSPVTTSGNITLNLPTASATNRGLLSSADWAIFDAKQGSITLTTTGNNGSATLTSGTLNIPTYTLAGLGGISLTSLSASSPLAYNNTTGAFSIQVANGSQNGYLSSSDWTTFNSKQSALTFSSPLVNTSGTISIPAATSSVNGYLTSTDWVTFNSKQGAITLTTTGSSGAATLIGTTLNIPNYSGALTGYVPYTGATGNVDLGEYGISSGYFQADLTPSGTLQVGRMQWNSTDGTMDLRLMGNNVTLQIGQEQVARVVNGTGANLLESNYQAVKIIGAQGQRLQVGLAKADNDANSKDTLGLVTENINNNQEGFITVSGLVNEINTTGSLQGETWADGDTLYLSGTTSGAITNVKPTAPIHTVIVGFVVYAHQNHGKIFVKVDNGYELEELHDVAPTPYVNKGVLYRDTATNLWKSATIGTLLGYTPANAATTLTINGTAYDLSANRTWNVGTVTSIGTSGPLTGGTITGSGTIGITQATTSTDGYLSSTDWNTFNNKQAAGSYITALTGEATATGPGSASVTLSTSAVTGKLLTGLNLTGGGTIADTDSILQAFGKVQNQISGLAGGVTYQGVWNASTNTPTLTSSVGTKGYYYIVDVAGSTNLNGITDWKVGDWAIFNGSTWDKVDNTDAVSSVNGFTGAVSLTTSNIAEGTNLYYLDSRARLALSFTAGSGAYDNTTGVITIPTNTSQLTNGANFITLSSLSASSPLSYNNVSGAFSIQVANGSQNGYLSSSDWTTFNNKQAALTLTTTGSSGSSTLVGATLNVPTYTLSGLGGVPTSRTLTINGTSYDLSSDRTWSVGTITGTGTSNYLPKWQSSSALGDSLVYDASTAILIGTTTASTAKFMVYSATADNHYQAIGSAPSFRFADTITSPTYTGIIGLATASNHFIVGAAAGDMVLANNTTSSLGNFIFGTGTTERMRITPTGNVSINNTNNTYRFDVNGTVRFTGQLRLESTITNGTYTYTLPSATGTLALTSDIPSGGITGSGTTNYLPKFTGTSTIGNSLVYDNGTNVGIGTATPYSATNYKFLTIDGTNGSGFVTRVSSINSFLAYSNSGGTTLSEQRALPIVFETTGTSRMTLDASGNLGLGVTPSAWNSDYVAMQFGAKGLLYGRSGGEVAFGTNWYRSSGGSFLYATNGFASYQAQADGVHYWFIAPSGTAGNAISFTQAMTLNASGNLSIGNTNDSYKLDVSGTGRFTGQLHLPNNSTGTNAGLFFDYNVNAASRSWCIVSDYDVYGDFQIKQSTTQTGTTFAKILGFSPTGAATFSSSVTASGGLISNGGSIGYGGGELGFGVTSSGATSAIYTLAVDSPVLYFDHRATGNTGFWVWRNGSGAGSERMRLTASGNLGIGTTSPSGKLHIAATTGTASPGSIALAIRDSGNSGYGFDFNLEGVATGDLSLMRTEAGSQAQVMTFKRSNGNVGIGTTSPSYNLEVWTASSGSLQNALNVTNGANADFTVRIKTSETWIGPTTATPLIFANSSNTERMRITSGGNVGIGTTSPASVGSYKVLDIQGSSGGMLYLSSNGSDGGRVYGNSGGLTYDAFAAGHTWYTPGGERMRITSGGNVGIGTTSISNAISGTETVLKIANSNVASLYLDSTGTGKNYAIFSSASGNLTFYDTTAGSERMRITSGGDLMINQTSGGEGKLRVTQSGSYWNTEFNHTYSTQYWLAFRYNGTNLGSITGNGSSVSFNTSSDYRLKTDLKDFSGLDLVSKIKAYDYEWKSDKTRSYGVIAHELQSVINYAVTGVKDGKQMQGVDYSKIVPVNTKAIQELYAIIQKQQIEIEQLKNK